MKKLRDIMRHGFLFTLQRGATVAEACHMMATNNVGIVAVLDGDRLAGVLSERDVVQKVIDRGLDPGAPQNINFYELSPAELRKRRIKLLPQTLGEALDELEADKFFASKLGPEIISEFIKIKRMEWVEYSRHVSDWELKRYLEFY